MSGNRLIFPRGFVSLNGTQINWVDFNISTTRYGSAGTFNVNIPVSALPKTLSLDKLIGVDVLTVQINAGNSTVLPANNVTASDMPLIMLGDADSIAYDPKHSMVTINGRDYISKFIENEIYPRNFGISPSPNLDISALISSNLTASQIIEFIGNNRGLSVVAQKTTTQVGYYMSNPNIQSMLNSNITEWDLMTLLARQEAFDIYISGTTLYFQPLSSEAPYTVTITSPFFTNPGEIPQSNITDIQLTRNMRLAKDVIVNVYSRDIYNENTIQSSVSLAHDTTTTTASTANENVYNFVYPNITKEQADARARSLLANISRHEMAIQFNLPADNSITTHSVISIVGTNSMYDQTYYVNNVTMEMSTHAGFNMTVNAINQSPSTVTVVA